MDASSELFSLMQDIESAHHEIAVVRATVLLLIRVRRVQAKDLFEQLLSEVDHVHDALHKFQNWQLVACIAAACAYELYVPGTG
jgi:hypothetical protein